jgi:hypothetical protein
MAVVGTAHIDIAPRTEGLVRTIRIIEKHLGALADELEQSAGEPDSPADGHVPGARPPRY